MRIALCCIFFSLLACTAEEYENFYAAQADFYQWPKDISVRPQPISVKKGEFMIPLSSAFQISFPDHPILANAVSRYKSIIWGRTLYPNAAKSTHIYVTPLNQLNLVIRDLKADLHHGVDESYNLTVPSDGTPATLSAQTAWGAIWGLETFSQLIRSNNANSYYPLLIPCPLFILDYPLFPHRGIMLDTTRVFYNVKDILQTITEMRYHKFNVLHWHITLSDSFPLHLPSEPALAQKGSMTYTQQDVRAIIEYGRNYAVRVIPEIDTPAQTLSWGKAYPEILTCADYNFSGKPIGSKPGAGHLNPLHPETYKVVKNVVNDVASMFPDRFYHGGNSEILPDCWKENAEIQKFLGQGGTLSELLEKFVSTTYPYITAHNKTVIYWEDVLLNATIKVRADLLPKESTILQTWNKGWNNTKLITSAGYRTIVSSSDFYYLDCDEDSSYDEYIGEEPGNIFNYEGPSGGSWCAQFKLWKRVNEYNLTYGLSEEETKLVLGGEVTLWSEQGDGTAFHFPLWPRPSAMAETLWSGIRGMRRGHPQIE